MSDNEDNLNKRQMTVIRDKKTEAQKIIAGVIMVQTNFGGKR